MSHDPHNDHESHDQHGHHDEHHEAHDSHDEHDSHGHHGDHDAHGSHDEHQEDHEEELTPIEPAGFLNDIVLAGSESLVIDVTGDFPFREAFAINHNPHRIWNDMWTGKAPTIDLSQKLTMRVISKPTPRLLDIYPSATFAPSLLSSFTRKAVSPRFRYVDLCPKLPEFPDTAVDVRDGKMHPTVRLRPDIYMLDLPLGKRLRRLRRKHGKKVAKMSAGFALGAVIAIVLLGMLANSIKTTTLDAYTQLIALKELEDPQEISTQISSLRKEFQKAEFMFLPFETLIRLGIAQSENLDNASHAIHGGRALLEAFASLDSIRDELAKWVNTGTGAALTYTDPRLLSTNTLPLTDIFERRSKELNAINTELKNAVLEFSSVNNIWDPAKEEQLIKAVYFLDSISRSMDFILTHQSEIFALLGDKAPKHYLILNQNRDEMRANGGFPGSAVELVFYKGRLQSYEKKDIYFYDWRLFPYGETPPPGIDKITSVYGMRDANYYPDFKETLTTISRMYEKAGGGTLDGIIAINQGFITDLLRITGPVNTPGIKESINSNNFSLILSVLVESEIGRKSSAKDILFSFIEDFEKKLRETGEYTQYLDILEQNVAAGEILVAHRDPDLDAFVHRFIPDDAYKWREDNFVYPVLTSLSGNKSDRYMHRTFNLTAKSLSGCTTLGTFNLKSSHDFDTGTREQIRRMLFDYGIPADKHEHELYVQGNGENVQFIRVLLPKWSVLKSQASVPIEMDDTHEDYTSIQFTVRTKVLENSDVSFTYESTPKNCAITPTFLKQPGLQNYNVNIR